VRRLRVLCGCSMASLTLPLLIHSPEGDPCYPDISSLGRNLLGLLWPATTLLRRMAVYLKLLFVIALLVLAGTVSENCHATDADSRAPAAEAYCEKATIEEICNKIGSSVSARVNLKTLEGNIVKSADDKDDGIRLNLVCTSCRRISLNLYSARTGSIPLNNSAQVGKGLVISAFGLRHKERRAANQTSGTFVILNKCGLLDEDVTIEGMLFGDSQIEPRLIEGRPDRKNLGASMCRRDEDEGENDTIVPEVAWDLSGLYKTKIPDFQCLRGKGYLDGTRVLDTPISGGNVRREEACPAKDTRMVVDMAAGAGKGGIMPIINLDSGNGLVFHFIDSPRWRDTDCKRIACKDPACNDVTCKHSDRQPFTVNTTPGNSFNVNFPIINITITPKDKNTMDTVVNFPRFGTVDPYEAHKCKDLYDDLGIRPSHWQPGDYRCSAPDSGHQPSKGRKRNGMAASPASAIGTAGHR
jgi:hypothetical protein